SSAHQQELLLLLMQASPLLPPMSLRLRGRGMLEVVQKEAEMTFLTVIWIKAEKNDIMAQ
ncbi:MAG: hypothetical protein Q4B85_12860, partial [Lachnospiraceae bacterium]|nr:hypothetical protein [Lachnospiraceae bacterium]